MSDKNIGAHGWTQLVGQANLKQALSTVLPSVLLRLERDTGLGVQGELIRSLRGKLGWVSCLGITRTRQTYGLIAVVTFDKHGSDLSYRIDTEFSGLQEHEVPPSVWRSVLNHADPRDTLGQSALFRQEVRYRLDHPLEDGCECDVIADAWKLVGTPVRLVSLRDKMVVPLEGRHRGIKIRLGGDMSKVLRCVVRSPDEEINND